MGHGDIANDLLDLEARRRRGEPINEFQSARIHAEYRLARIIDALNSGMPRSEVIGILAITSQTSRRVACDALGKVLRKAKFDQPQESLPAAAKVKIHAEVSKGQPAPATPKPAPPAAVAQKVKSVSSPEHPDFKISAPAELAEKLAAPTGQKPFRVGIRVGPANFAGVDDVMTEQQQEEIRQSHKALAAMEAKYGTAKEQADRIKKP
jgi:hypothetical protein